VTRFDRFVAFAPFVLLLLVVWLGTVSTVGTPEGCAAGCATASQRVPGPLRVVNLNVLHGFPADARLADRLDLIANELVRLDADVALLQEVPWTLGTGSGAARLAQRTGLNYLALRANGNRFAIAFEEGSVILSRYPLADVSWIELAPRAGPFEHRIALAATADTDWGPIRLVVTHLSGADAVNAAQAASLVDWVARQPRPVLIGGDFNAVPDSVTYRELPWTDLYRSVHPDDGGFTCCVDALDAPPPAPLAERIDYLFALGLEATSAEVILAEPVAVANGWLRASDHAGLLVRLEPR
jgi:endonuclease/exonuclease/phosphatase family metal-dependent hydrolase